MALRRPRFSREPGPSRQSPARDRGYAELRHGTGGTPMQGARQRKRRMTDFAREQLRAHFMDFKPAHPQALLSRLLRRAISASRFKKQIPCSDAGNCTAADLDGVRRVWFPTLVARAELGIPLHQPRSIGKSHSMCLVWAEVKSPPKVQFCYEFAQRQ